VSSKNFFNENNFGPVEFNPHADARKLTSIIFFTQTQLHVHVPVQFFLCRNLHVQMSDVGEKILCIMHPSRCDMEKILKIRSGKVDLHT